jgi:hypothetical protein
MSAETGSPITTYFRVCDGVRVRFADTAAALAIAMREPLLRRPLTPLGPDHLGHFRLNQLLHDLAQRLARRSRRFLPRTKLW